MGALPKRRISSKRRGTRRANIKVTPKQPKQHPAISSRQGLIASFRKLLGV